MAWPTTAWATDDLVLAPQLNSMPVMIADVTLGASSAAITFTSIPQHYAHLRMMLYLRSDGAATTEEANVRFNGDTASNYDYQSLAGSAAVVTAFEQFAGGYIGLNVFTGAGAGANLFPAAVLDFANYGNVSNNKVVIAKAAFKRTTTTGTMKAVRLAGFWRSSTAITTIAVAPVGGTNWVAGSRATLYGLP